MHSPIVNFLLLLLLLEYSASGNKAKNYPLKSPRKTRQLGDTDDNNEDNEAVPASGTARPMLDLEMFIPHLKHKGEMGSSETGELSSDERVSELTMEFQYEDDDGTPPSTMTIYEPNFAKNGDGIQKLSIPMDSVTPSTSEVEDQNGGGEIIRETDGSGNESVIDADLLKEQNEHKPHPHVTCPCESMEAILEKLDFLKGEKGDTGPAGPPGLSIQGSKGEPGAYPLISYKNPASGLGMDGIKGERGPPGLPGVCPSSCGSKVDAGGKNRYSGSQNVNGNANTNTESSRPQDGPPKSLYKIVPGALVFPTRSAMLQMKEFTFIGTVAFVEADEAFYGRVKAGWRSFTMGGRVHRTSWESSNSTITVLNRPKPVLNRAGTGTDNKGSVLSESLLKCGIDSFPGVNGTCVRIALEPTLQLPLDELKGSKDFSESQEQRDEGIVRPQIEPLKVTSRIIALNSPYSGDMGGLDHINYKCQKQAMKSHLTGVFRSILSSPLRHFQPPAGTVFVNLINETLWKYPSYHGKRAAVGLYSFNGKRVTVTPEGQTWTWTGPYEKIVNGDCQSWTSDNPNSFGMAKKLITRAHPQTTTSTASTFNTLNLNPFASNSFLQIQPCNKKFVVLCIEIMKPIPPHPHVSHIRHGETYSTTDKRSSNEGRHEQRLRFSQYLAILQRYDEARLL